MTGIPGSFFQFLLYCGKNTMSSTLGIQNLTQTIRILAIGGVASVQSNYFFLPL